MYPTGPASLIEPWQVNATADPYSASLTRHWQVALATPPVLLEVFHGVRPASHPASWVPEEPGSLWLTVCGSRAHWLMFALWISSLKCHLSKNVFNNHQLNFVLIFYDSQIVKAAHQPRKANIPPLHWYNSSQRKETWHVVSSSKATAKGKCHIFQFASEKPVGSGEGVAVCRW